VFFSEEDEGMSIVALFMFLVFFVLGVGGTILWTWMIVDCATEEQSGGNEKLIWMLIIVLTHCIGALTYLLVRRPKRIQQYEYEKASLNQRLNPYGFAAR
jgi:uncharacterized membrane protein YedE/YeeE